MGMAQYNRAKQKTGEKYFFFSQEINKAFQEIYAETVEEFNMYYSIKCMAQFVMKNMNAISMKNKHLKYTYI